MTSNAGTSFLEKDMWSVDGAAIAWRAVAISA